MPCRFYISPLFQDLACRIEEKCRTYDTDIDLPIVFLLSDHTILFMELPIFIWDEYDVEWVLIAELRMRGFAILRYSDDLDSERFEVVPKPREVLRFERAAWCIILRIEIEESLRWVREEWRENRHIIRYSEIMKLMILRCFGIYTPVKLPQIHNSLLEMIHIINF